MGLAGVTGCVVGLAGVTGCVVGLAGLVLGYCDWGRQQVSSAASV